MKDIHEYELNLWLKAQDKELKKLAKIKATKDPGTVLLEVYKEFQELMDSGKDRTSKEFGDRVKELSQIEKREQKRLKTFSFSKQSDEKVAQEILVHDINCKVAHLRVRRLGKL